MSTERRYIVIEHCCSICKKSYSSPRNLREHYATKCKTPIYNILYKRGMKRELPNDVIVVDLENINENLQYTTEFSCPGCYDLFKDLEALDSHVTIEHGLEADDTTFIKDETYTNVPSITSISPEPVSTETEATATVSLHNAMESLYPEHSNTDNKVISNVITSLNLKPFVINSCCTDDSKVEVTALSTPSQYKRLLDVNARGIKRVRLDTPEENAAVQSNDCIHVKNMSNDINLNEIMSRSPYRRILAFEEYSHITEEHQNLLNSHWRKRPFMYMVTSQLLAGAILVDGNQALLLNGVEAYCRYPSVDVHHENLSNTEESSIPDLCSQYPNLLKITKINMDKSEKLVIGSKSMNVLVVSSIRIDDSKLAPEVGPSTKNFTPSKNTQIFLATSSIKLANKILDDPSSFTLCDPLINLRQLRSKYLQPSTYALARFFSVFTPDITVQPYTVYTLVNSTSNNNTSCMMGSKAMEHIALSVLEGNGKLKKEEVKQLLVNTQGKETQVSKDISKIIDLFEDDCELEIFGNSSLSSYLRSIAISTTNGLKDANADIIKNIWNRFLRG